MSKEIKLKVVEAVADDVEKGIVRIDSNFMKETGIKPGDIIEINGDRKTVAVADRAYPGDIGLNIIRMDGIIRKNAKTGIGELVGIKKAEIKEAKKITIAPSRKGVIVKASSNSFKQGLLGRAVIKGDIISMGGTKRRRTAMADNPDNPFFDDVFKGFLEDSFNVGFGFGDLKFVVVDTNPKDAVIITESTEIVLNPEAVEVKEEIVSDVNYEDIGGLNNEIKKIREMVELPLKYPEIFDKLGIEPPKGVLLHGPPGTGKTLLAKAVANESDTHFAVINGPEIMSKFYGESEQNLRKFFEEAEKNAPSIIFIDEIDSLAPKREESKGEVERRVVAQLLALMDGLKSRGKVVVIAATNIPNSIDPALRRPGRFDREISINVPNKKGRLNILKIHTRNMPLEGSFYSDIAAKGLIKKIDERFDGLNKEVELNKNRILDTKSDIKKLQTKLKELEEMKKGRDASLVGQTLNLISQVNKKIDSKNNEQKDLEKELVKLERSIKKIDETKKLLEKKKSLLNDSIDSIKSIEHIKEIWSEKEKDERNIFIELKKWKVSEEVQLIITDLIELKVVNKEFYQSIRQNGIPRDLENMADITYGFVGADLEALAKESAMVVLRKVLPDLKLKDNQSLSKDVLEKLVVTQKEFREALKMVRPSALREVLIEKPNVKWEDIGGLDKAKESLEEAVEWPLKNPKDFKKMGITPPRGILLYGAPGTGKTLLAKAVATESKANFILVKGPELLSKWVGESEKAVREIFKKARQTAPTIIFFDEIDALAPRRGVNQGSHVIESVVNQILTELDGLETLNDVVVLAATNRPDIIDSALLRPGRFDRLILIPIPDKKTREEIFKVHTKGMPLEGVDIKKLVERTEGYTGSDIEALCREAAINALRKDMNSKEVTMANFENALKEIGPSVTKNIEKKYEELKDSLKSSTAKQMEEESPSYFG
ncbi:AAA family ATPase [Candidatus Woesearchaeota archaeon B3_Woes]|nr:MAG: AAA family ATPase [Candidatus Woesearchaeota archaeon B3_Woes]